MMGHIDIVNLLLARKANPSVQDSDGKTALHRAAEKSHLEVCRSLLQRDGSNLATIRDCKGKVPLELVPERSSQRIELLELFNNVL